MANNEQSGSVLALIITTLLSSHKVLDLVMRTPLHDPLPIDALREATYLSYLSWASRHPDHIFENGWSYLTGTALKQPGAGGLIAHALQELAQEFLLTQHGELFVKREKFGAWQQSVLSRICSTPIIAAQTRHNQPLTKPVSATQNHFSTNGRGKWVKRLVPILHPHDPLVEDYISREGLHETHLHFNGSTHAELCWIRALARPRAEIRDFSSRWQEKTGLLATKTRELARAVNPSFSPVVLYRQLIAAANLRVILMTAADKQLDPATVLPARYDELCTRNCLDKMRLRPGRLPGADAAVEDEIAWQVRLLEQMRARPSLTLERLLHCYLLLQNHYYRLLVQSEEQSGFDQFQKFTFNELREPAEKAYLHRFLAMHGKYGNVSRVGYLEGRFAPKPTRAKNEALLYAILIGYWSYLNAINADIRSKDAPKPANLRETLEALAGNVVHRSPSDRRYQRLAIVAHFAKQPWSSTPAHKAGPYRFFQLRADLKRRTNELLSTLSIWPGLNVWLRGIDAAANEMHAPPEVFASCYRICDRAGLSRRSYHAGEDFPHLVTGIRHMLDVLTLLDFRTGDRIGHGTAMGIDPRLWLKRSPQKLIVRRGDWMLDLLGAWQLLRDIPEQSAAANQAAYQLAELTSQIFDEDISCTALERAMGFRKLDIHCLRQSTDPSWNWRNALLNDAWREEARQVSEARESCGKDLDLLWRWHSDPHIWSKTEELIEVESGHFTAETYLALQQSLMRRVAERDVIIETLPSSNVRISLYQNFSEHHSLRWMRVPGFVQEGDPPIMTSLGSDDPGIFAGDLNSQFYQLYAVLRNQGISDADALTYLSTINERGRQYRFHHPALG